MEELLLLQMAEMPAALAQISPRTLRHRQLSPAGPNLVAVVASTKAPLEQESHDMEPGGTAASAAAALLEPGVLHLGQPTMLRRPSLLQLLGRPAYSSGCWLISQLSAERFCAGTAVLRAARTDWGFSSAS